MTIDGRFVWYELMTSDPEGAKAFYTEVTGWGVQKWDGPMDYAMWTAQSGPVGGVMLLPDEARAMGAPPHWMGYVAVDDVDAATARAAALGATVLVPPTDIPGVGRFSNLQDPQGGVVSTYKSAASEGTPGTEPQVREFSWHELATSDLEGAWSFYEAVFGWHKTEAMDMGEMGTYQIFAAPDGVMLGAMYPKPPQVPVTSWLYYVIVPDLEAAMSAVRARGGQVLNGPMEVPGGVVAQCMDPQGAAFALHARSA